MTHLEILEKIDFLREIASCVGVEVPREVLAAVLDEIQSLKDRKDYQESDDRVLLIKRCRRANIYL